MKKNNFKLKSTPMQRKKKCVKILLLLISLVVGLKLFDIRTVANGLTKTEIENNLSTSVQEQLDDLDFSEMENILDGLEQNKFFKDQSFKEKVKSLLNGTYFTDYSSLFSCLISLIFDNLLKFLPTLLLVISICLLNNLLSVLKSDSKSTKGVGDIVTFVCFAVVIVVLIISVKEVISITKSTIDNMQRQMQAIFPITLTLLAAVGNVTTVSIYKPLVAVLSNGIPYIFSYIVYPVFIISFLFIVLNNLSSNIKLNKFIDFLNSFFKWSTGIVFTIFSTILALQGISAGRYDSVSVKATRFAIKSYVPIIGGYLSEGLDFIVLGSVLIKNAIGMAGLFMVFLTIISPILQIVVFKLGLQLTAAIIEPMSDGKSASFIIQISKVLVYPLVLIIGVAFSYILSLSLIMCTGNI